MPYKITIESKVGAVPDFVVEGDFTPLQRNEVELAMYNYFNKQQSNRFLEIRAQDKAKKKVSKV